MGQSHIYALQLVVGAAITLASQSLNMDSKHEWALSVVHYAMYFLTVQASEVISVLVYEVAQGKRELAARLFSKVNRNLPMLYVASVAVLYLNGQKLYAQDFPLMFIAYLVLKYFISSKTTLSHGAGLAYSYVEGYLSYVMPSDGEEAKGFEDRIRAFEDIHKVVFPVKRMFVVITRTMYCPPDLKEFNDNSGRKDASRLEACTPFEGVVRDVAGVKSREYRSAVYRLTRADKPAVLVVAECASPLYTLRKAIRNQRVYHELADIDVEEIVTDFMSTLRAILAKNQLADKCELVYFDDTDKSLNLPDVLLDRIKQLEPNFEELITRGN